jgi:hypothetical protein
VGRAAAAAGFWLIMINDASIIMIIIDDATP